MPEDAGSDRPLVSVVVVSFNTRDLTLNCLRALRADESGAGAEIFVVDNGSRDDSPAAVRAADPAVVVIDAGRNIGFGPANNLAFARARGQFVLLLNSDAFVRPGAIAAMVDVLRRDAGVGVVGCRLENADGSLQKSCWSFPSPGQSWAETLGLCRLGFKRDWHRWDHASEGDVDTVIGAAMMVRRDVIDRVGGFDEVFFLYAEETDWQRRIHDAGWRVRYTPAGTVVHLGGGSGAGLPDRQLVEFCRGNARYIRKHHGRRGLAVVRVAKVVGLLVRVPALWAAALFKRPGAAGRARERARHLRWWLGGGPREGYAELSDRSIEPRVF